MRVSEDMTLPEGFFCGDIPNGVKIECSECSKETDSFEAFYTEPLHCSHCGVELFYRPWWEW